MMSEKALEKGLEVRTAASVGGEENPRERQEKHTRVCGKCS